MSKNKLLLVTPPFVQLNTAYPATAYLKGFLNTLNVESYQTDLGLETVLELFSKGGLEVLFEQVEEFVSELSENAQRIYRLKSYYIDSVDKVISFLQHKNPTLAHSICTEDYLPQASRFNQLADLDWAFGSLGIQDKARHLATLYLEDISDFIQETIDPHFGFSRYAERLSRTASSFDELYEAVKDEHSLVTDILLQLLEDKIEAFNPTVLCLTVPFPGNLFAALKCAAFVKEFYPHIHVVMGGGYANTELRSIVDERFFEWVDFLSLDDGEAPLQCLLEYLERKREKRDLKRIFALNHGVVHYFNGAKEKDVPQRETGTPDYKDLLLEEYLSVIDVLNPMHRLWSDGRWNKLTLAHGCYWGKCSFCDISLDYIERYEPLTAELLCDRIETIIEQTGQNGFHFVDEAAPPALLRDLSLEILRRKLTVVWWTNIRFEKNFTTDLCALMKAAGCIAVSGGLEVASDRLLALMKKGVTVAQVARVCESFTQAGIMVHAYLMYGFPTQTAQETIDALEMVRQLFEAGIVQSGFWHRFAMTAHSPVGLEPEAYQVEEVGPSFDGFALNDLWHEDPLGTDHDRFAEGLRKSLFNYMYGMCLDYPLDEWFVQEVPLTTIKEDFIIRALDERRENKLRENKQLVMYAELPVLSELYEDEDGHRLRRMIFYNKTTDWDVELEEELVEILFSLLKEIKTRDKYRIKDLDQALAAYELTRKDLEDMGLWQLLRKELLWVV